MFSLSHKTAANVLQIGDARAFTIPIAIGIDAENQTLINHKCVCGALNRHFCQLKISEAKPVLCSRAIILSSNFLIQLNQKYQLP
jgi:hypothetical protein